MSSKTLAILAHDQYRRARLMQNAETWAAERGVLAVRVTEAELADFDWRDVGALYVPLRQDFDYLAAVPHGIPVIADYDGVGGGPKMDIRHSLALRKAFGGPDGLNVEFRVPYLHLPLDLPEPAVRDVIIIDAHAWLPASWHLTLMGYLAQLGAQYDRLCKIAGCGVKFYFTSMFPFLPYRGTSWHLAEKLQDGIPWVKQPPSPLEVIHSHLIPPCERIADYYDVLARGRLFLTDNGDLADQDVVHAISQGVQIGIIPRDPFTRSFGITHSLEAAGVAISGGRWTRVCGLADLYQKASFEQGMERLFETFLKFSQAVDLNINPTIRETFMRSWDILWHWALTGERNEAVHKATTEAPPCAHHRT